MRCVICHLNEIEGRDGKEEINVENNVVYVPIKIPVCKN